MIAHYTDFKDFLICYKTWATATLNVKLNLFRSCVHTNICMFFFSPTVSFINIDSHVSLVRLGSGPVGDDDHYQIERGPQRQHVGPLGELGGSRKELGGYQREQGGSQWELSGPQELGGPQMELGGFQMELGGFQMEPAGRASESAGRA